MDYTLLDFHSKTNARRAILASHDSTCSIWLREDTKQIYFPHLSVILNVQQSAP